MSIEQVAVTIHYDPGSWPHWHWRAEIVGSERGADYDSGMAITRAGANVVSLTSHSLQLIAL